VLTEEPGDIIRVDHPRHDEERPRRDGPEILPERKLREQEAVQDAKPCAPGDRHGKGQKGTGEDQPVIGVEDQQDPGQHQIGDQKLRHRIQDQPGKDRIHDRHPGIGQKLFRIAQRLGDLRADRQEHRERQQAGRVEQHEIVAQRRRPHRHGKRDRQHRDAGDGFENRPDIPARRAAIGRRHLAQHQRKDRPCRGQPTHFMRGPQPASGQIGRGIAGRGHAMGPGALG
jgi:hypothetical protein